MNVESITQQSQSRKFNYNKSHIVAMAALASALTLSGCSTAANYIDKVRRIGDAETNTIPLRSGHEEYNFRHARIDEIFADGETYTLIPMENGSTVNVKGKTLDQRVILAARFVPHGDSSYIRTEKEIKVVPHEKIFYGVNAFQNASNQFEINSGIQEKSSFFIMSHTQFPEKLRSDELNIIQERLLEKTKKEAGYVEIRGERYISLPAQNPEGPDRVLLPLERTKPVYYERRTPQGTTVQFGLNGPGYFLVEGIETPADPTSKGTRVIEMSTSKVN